MSDLSKQAKTTAQISATILYANRQEQWVPLETAQKEIEKEQKNALLALSKLQEKIETLKERIKELKLVADSAHQNAQWTIDAHHKVVEDKKALLAKVAAAQTLVTNARGFITGTSFYKEVGEALKP